MILKDKTNWNTNQPLVFPGSVVVCGACILCTIYYLSAMRAILLFSFLLSVTPGQSQDYRTLLAGQASFEAGWLQKYHRLKGSLDEVTKLRAMQTLPYFAFDTLFRVVARLDTVSQSDYFQLQTSQHRAVWYRTYGQLNFTLAGKKYRMPVYQSRASVMSGESELFFPFTDLTNGTDTYGGGRYIEMPIPAGDTFVLDFNKSFNPYCVYSHGYSCELVPEENHFDVAIRAGIKVKN